MGPRRVIRQHVLGFCLFQRHGGRWWINRSIYNNNIYVVSRDYPPEDPAKRVRVRALCRLFKWNLFRSCILYGGWASTQWTNVHGGASITSVYYDNIYTYLYAWCDRIKFIRMTTRKKHDVKYSETSYYRVLGDVLKHITRDISY